MGKCLDKRLLHSLVPPLRDSALDSITGKGIWKSS